MNGTTSLLAHRLKKLMQQASTGMDVTGDVRSLLESDRSLRAERAIVIQEPLRLLSTHGLADSTGL